MAKATRQCSQLELLIRHIIDTIDELDGYKCMLVTERERLKKLRDRPKNIDKKIRR